jgi:hypothetical protein
VTIVTRVTGVTGVTRVTGVTGVTGVERKFIFWHLGINRIFRARTPETVLVIGICSGFGAWCLEFALC